MRYAYAIPGAPICKVTRDTCLPRWFEPWFHTDTTQYNTIQYNSIYNRYGDKDVTCVARRSYGLTGGDGKYTEIEIRDIASSF